MAERTNVMVIESTFSNNRAGRCGGAIYLQRGSIEIQNSTFDSNSGGVCLDNMNNVTIKQSSFINNNRTAMFISDGDRSKDSLIHVSIVESRFISNRGRALTLQFRKSSSIAITQTIFIGNTASRGAGALQTFGNNITFLSSGNTFSENLGMSCAVDFENANHRVNITTNTFTGNKRGAICINDATISITNSTFSNHNTTNVGGVLNSVRSTVSIQGSDFYNNSAGGFGGALYVVGSGSSLTTYQSNFINNTA